MGILPTDIRNPRTVSQCHVLPATTKILSTFDHHAEVRICKGTIGINKVLTHVITPFEIFVRPTTPRRAPLPN